MKIDLLTISGQLSVRFGGLPETYDWFTECVPGFLKGADQGHVHPFAGLIVEFECLKAFGLNWKARDCR